MSFGILSGTTSIGLGCCAWALRASAKTAPANARRFMTALLPWWKKLAQGVDARLGDLFVFVGLHAGHAHAADAGAVDDDRQSALHRRDLRHAEHRIAAGLDAFFPYERGAARLRRRLALGNGGARIERRGAVHAREVQQVAAIVEDGDADDPVVLARLGFGGGGNLA